jgi:hypothetical protein
MSRISNFITKLVVHFPVRFESPEREAEWLGSMASAIGSYDGEVLQKAAQRIIDTRTDRRFPLTAEIRKVCAQIVSETKSTGLPLQGETSRERVGYTPEHIEWTYKLMSCEMGRRAATEDWAGFLFDFVAKHNRLPTPKEQADLKAEIEPFEKAYRACLTGNGGECGKALARFGDKFMKRRTELADRLLHGVVAPTKHSSTGAQNVGR